jgi:hypothetical protein
VDAAPAEPAQERLEQCFWRALWMLMQCLEIQVDLGRYAASALPFKLSLSLQQLSELNNGRPIHGFTVW